MVCCCVVVWVLLSMFCISSLDDCMHPQHQETTIIFRFFSICFTIRACLHGGGGPQIGEVICGWSPHLSCKRDQIKMRDYVDRWVTHQSRLPHLPGALNDKGCCWHEVTRVDLIQFLLILNIEIFPCNQTCPCTVADTNFTVIIFLRSPL